MATTDPIKQTIKTYNTLATHYATQYVDRTHYQQLYDFFFANLKGREVLDIGCGPGHDAAVFIQRNLDVTGIDLSEELLKLAKKAAPHAKFANMDMRKLDYKPGSFDGLWVMASFQHLPKKYALKTLIGFRKVLRSHGLMYLSVTEGEGEGLQKKERYLGNVKYFANYTEAEISNLLTAAGFSVLKIFRAKTTRQNQFLDVFAQPSTI